MRRQPKERGTVVLVALCFTAVIGIALATYLTLCQHSLQASTRTTHLSEAGRLAEIGIEEALWNLSTARKNTAAVAATAWAGWTFADAVNSTESYGSNADPTTSQLFHDAGIDADDDDVGALTDTTNDDCTRTFTYTLGNGATAQVGVAVTNYQSTSLAAPPIIRAVSKITLSSGQTFTRKFRAKAKRAPLFPNAIASANSNVTFNYRATVDSWNSDPSGLGTFTAYSGGTAPANFAAVVAGKTGVIIYESTINGYLATNDSNASWDSSGFIHGKVKGPSTASGTDVDQTRVGKSAFIPLYDIVKPTGAASSVPGAIDGVITGANDSATYGSGATSPVILDADDLDISTGETLTIDGPVIIRVSDDLAVSDTGSIVVTSNGSLTLFVNDSMSISGSGGIRNNTNDPRKLAIFNYGNVPSDTIYFTTSVAFTGVIYSRYRPIDVNTNAVIIGALLSGSWIYFGSSPTIHYDLALRNPAFTGIDQPFLLDDVTEL